MNNLFKKYEVGYYDHLRGCPTCAFQKTDECDDVQTAISIAKKLSGTNHIRQYVVYEYADHSANSYGKIIWTEPTA